MSEYVISIIDLIAIYLNPGDLCSLIQVNKFIKSKLNREFRDKYTIEKTGVNVTKLTNYRLIYIVDFHIYLIQHVLTLYNSLDMYYLDGRFIDFLFKYNGTVIGKTWERNGHYYLNGFRLEPKLKYYIIFGKLLEMYGLDQTRVNSLIALERNLY